MLRAQFLPLLYMSLCPRNNYLVSRTVFILSTKPTVQCLLIITSKNISSVQRSSQWLLGRRKTMGASHWHDRCMEKQGAVSRYNN